MGKIHCGQKISAEVWSEWGRLVCIFISGILGFAAGKPRQKFESPAKKENGHRKSGFRFLGPSGETRTPGILLPKQARYQLRYTRL